MGPAIFATPDKAIPGRVRRGQDKPASRVEIGIFEALGQILGIFLGVAGLVKMDVILYVRVAYFS